MMKLDEQYKRATSNVVVKETEHIVRGSSVPVSPKPIVRVERVAAARVGGTPFSTSTFQQ